MHLLDLFESTVEGYTVTRGIDRDRYQERTGLEGPFQTKSGKVVYYDKKEGKYYDPDSDMYIDHDDYRELDEGVGTYLKGAVLAGLLGLGVNQMADMASAKNSPLGQAMAQAAEQGDEYAARHLNKLDLYMDSNDTGSIKILSKRYLNKTIESVYEEVATNKRTERILGLLRAKNPTAQNDLEALILSFEKGQRQDREDINTLYTQNSEEDKEIEALEKELERIKNKRKVSEDYYETDEQRELARLGRILKDMGKKRDDKVGEAMGFLGTQLTRFGTPQGVNSIEKLEQKTGLPESVIMKMMALAQKVKGDVAVGDETAGNDEDEVKEALRKVPYAGYKGPGSDFRAYDEPDQRSNWVVKVGGKKWKVFANEKTARKAAYTVQQKYGKETEVYATMDPVSEGAAKDFDDNFSKYIGYTLGGGEPAKMLQKQVAQRQADNPDAGTGLGPSVLNIPKAREKAAKRGIKAPGNLRASPNTRDPKRLPEGWAESPMVSASIPNNTSDTAARLQRLAKENGVEYARQGRTVTLTGPRMNVRNIFFKMAYAPGNHPEMVPVTEGLDHDIRIGDTVETKKMGQMQGVVTGFSTKTGDTRVMFKHKSGKVYATVPDNLRVIDSVKKTEGLDDTVVEAKKKPVPTKPELWSRAKAAAKQKYDVYPSAYANAFASKWYKEKGGGWRMGNPKK